MSDEEIDVDKQFRSVADAFIHLANKQAETVPRENVSMALLYAAARFNSFIVATHAPDQEKFQRDREAASEFFLREYKRMLQENLDDYAKIYNENKYAQFIKKDS